MSNGPKIIEKRASDLKNAVEGLETEKQNRIVIERDVIPIIFVPGIMGSRLKNRAGRVVWEPDSKGFMVKTYGLKKADAELKKMMLIGEQGKFDSNYLTVAGNDESQSKDNKQIKDREQIKSAKLEKKHSKRIADPSGKDKTRKERGWGGVSWGSYGPILKALQTRLWDPTVSLFYEFPVHAFGYNWTASNDLAGKKLAELINKTTQKYKDDGRHCDKVILVTHSMGGLVARSAYMLHGVKDKILGIVHGVQPSNGSPAAYWRMKGGFERPHSVPDLDPMQWFKNPVRSFKHKTNKMTSGIQGTITTWVLGTDGKEVTALLGNMPGGLELLPNKRYTNNDGSNQWLELIDEDGSRIALPKFDPYREIYSAEDVYYRLVNPEWLNPGKSKTTNNSNLVDLESDWNLYLINLDEAETFHDELTKNDLHEETYQFYSSGIASADRVVLKAVDDTFRNTVNHKLGIGKNRSQDTSDRSVTDHIQDIPKWIIFGSVKGVMDVKDLLADWYFSRGGYRKHFRMDGKTLSKEGRVHMVTLQLPDGAGDGTVPESSAMALKLNTDKKRTFCIADQREFEAKAIEANKRLKPKKTPDFDEGYFDRGHEPIYKTQTARFITFTAIENMCRAVIAETVGVKRGGQNDQPSKDGGSQGGGKPLPGGDGKPGGPDGGGASGSLESKSSKDSGTKGSDKPFQGGGGKSGGGGASGSWGDNTSNNAGSKGSDKSMFGGGRSGGGGAGRSF